VFDNKSYNKYLSSELYFRYLESCSMDGEKVAREENKIEKRIIVEYQTKQIRESKRDERWEDREMGGQRGERTEICEHREMGV